MIDKRNIKNMTRRNVAKTINSFNNACFKKVEKISDGVKSATFFYFAASNFAADGIKRYFGEEFVHDALPTGTYYLNYSEFIRKSNLQLI